MIRIDGTEVECHEVVYFVEVVDGALIEAEDLQDAKAMVALMGGTILVKHFYETAYAELSEGSL